MSRTYGTLEEDSAPLIDDQEGGTTSGAGITRWRSEDDDERINLHHSYENTSFTSGTVLLDPDPGYEEGEEDEEKITLSSFKGTLRTSADEQQHADNDGDVSTAACSTLVAVADVTRTKQS